MSAPVVVTGAGGFVGRHLVRALEARNERVIPVARPAFDVTDMNAVRAALGGVERCRVVHLAASRPRGGALADFRAAYDTNLYGLLNVLDALDGRCDRLVSLGTTEEFGAIRPPFEAWQREAASTAYGVSKLAATHLVEALARDGGLSSVILRPTVVYGPGQRGAMLIPSLLRALTAGVQFPMSAGEQTRDYVYVDDVVSAILCALAAADGVNSALPVSSGVPVRIRDVALSVARLVGAGAEALIEFGAEPYRVGEPMAYWADNAATRTAIGWEPIVPLDEGLRRTVSAWRSSEAIA